MGEVVPARTSPTLHPPSPLTVHQLSRLALQELSTVRLLHCTTRTKQYTRPFIMAAKRTCLPTCARVHTSPSRKINVDICNHQTDCTWALYLISMLVICNL